MKHTTFMKTSYDRLSFYFQLWQPEGESKAVLCLVHGLGEHSGRYQHVAEFLTQNGLAMLGYDLRGHGNSEGLRGHLPSAEAFLQDTQMLIDEGKRTFPDKPVFLYGHSLGGIIVLFYTLKQKPALQGIIASAPGLRTALEEQKSKLLLAKILAPLFPRLSMPSGLDATKISRDPAVVQAYQEDPLVHDRATLAFAVNSLKMIEYCLDHAKEFKLPLLLMHGEDDQIAFPKSSQEFGSQVEGDVTIKIWENLYHETHNEAEKGAVLAYLKDWIIARLPN